MSAVVDATHPDHGVQSAPQLRYARLLEWGTWVGLVVLVGSFVAMVAGWLPAHVSTEQLPQLWAQPVGDYLAQTGSPQGWGWLALLQHGDMLGLAGIGILAGCSAVALLALVPMYLAGGDRAFLFLTLLQVAVLLAAASGWMVH